MGFSRAQGALVASVLTVASVASVAFQSENLVDAAKKGTLNKTEYTLKVGEAFKLKLKGAKAVKFASTNKKVAKVSASGKVKAKKAGTATIKVYDENGKVYKCKVTVTKKKDTTIDKNNIDLGGMEIIIRDWWSSGELSEPRNAYEKAQQEYRKAMMEKYNFKIKEMAISDWGSVPQDFVDYASAEPDEKNYVFVLRNDSQTIDAMTKGLMYDLSTLDCLDFSAEKFQINRTHEMYSYGSHIYCCFAGPSEPRDGIFFNPNVLIDAGIDPDSIYDMQANGTWTWDAFESIMAKCQRDTDGDGEDDIFGLCCNNGVCVTAAVISNGGEYIGKENGKFTYRLEDPATTEALNWIVDIFNKYNNHDPEDAMWDYYMQDFKSGKVAFMMDQEYQATVNGAFVYDTPFTPGFVMFPKGPKAETYLNLWDNNPHAIPANYDADRAWKIAFAWNLYTNPVPGYEDYNGYVVFARDGIVDSRAVKETIPMMSQPEHGTVTYHTVIPNIKTGEDFIWGMNPGADVAAAQEEIRDIWKDYIKEANRL